MINQKDNKIKKNPPIFTKDDFLRVLDRAIKPHGQGKDKTSEKPDSGCYNEKHTHQDNSEDI